MNEVIDEEKKKQFPLYGFLDYFVNNFTNEHYEYALIQLESVVIR